MPKSTRHHKRSPIAEFLALSDAERRAVTAQFDREFVADSFRPLTPAQKKLWAKAKRKRSGPRKAAG